MYASRSCGYAGSSGTYALPARSVASTATTISTERSRHTATGACGPAPARRSRAASRSAAASRLAVGARPGAVEDGDDVGVLVRAVGERAVEERGGAGDEGHGLPDREEWSVLWTRQRT
ncbi:hypothetical protein GCM10025868_25490 [Angustibacter aerolatus]|uniref:Uncharacterized protein n=1 Tax=Angustibacter aerolatus TaxID=1162965 RepID=A0ABQ6JHJ7_9ACTN|nr:hypothetical protein GCM10025868_25490 [Angustibacter aerolatus]